MTVIETPDVFMEPVLRLSKDIVQAAVTLTKRQARYLVSTYYKLQKDRIRDSHQYEALAASGEPNQVIEWTMAQSSTLEQQIKKALDRFSLSREVSIWARGQVGVGPIIAAGMLAHLDVNPWRCPPAKERRLAGRKPDPCRPTEPCSTECAHGRVFTVGEFWRRAGLDPTVKKEKGKLLPWNPELKRLCWILGDVFMKFQNHENCFYGRIVAARKSQEVAKNENGDFRDQAEHALATVNYGKTTDAYKAYIQGKLPDSRIMLRAERYAVKLFLSHWHRVAYEAEFGEMPPAPYAITILGHGHIINPPGWTSKI